jgi:uncharacterized membrane protein YgaE (UPF0421/DUF939 family)
MGKGIRNSLVVLMILFVIIVLFLIYKNKTVINESTISENEKITLKIYAQYADDETKYPYDYAVEKLKEAYQNVILELDIQAQDAQ